MEPIKLEEIVPTGSSFKLKQTGREYRLRPVSLNDEKWLSREFGPKLNDVFQNMDMVEVCRIAFHQMEEADKADFVRREIKIMNEAGEYVRGEVGGAELLAAMISGIQEKMDLFHAMLETIGVSRPVIEKIAAEEKKTFESAQKQIGPISSINSAPNTDGLPSTSSPEQPAKSITASKELHGGKKPRSSSKRKSTATSLRG